VTQERAELESEYDPHRANPRPGEPLYARSTNEMLEQGGSRPYAANFHNSTEMRQNGGFSPSVQPGGTEADRKMAGDCATKLRSVGQGRQVAKAAEELQLPPEPNLCAAPEKGHKLN